MMLQSSTPLLYYQRSLLCFAGRQSYKVELMSSGFTIEFFSESKLNMRIRRAVWPMVLAFALFLEAAPLPLQAQDIESAISAGKQAVESGRPDEALDLFSLLIASDPQAVLYYYRGLAYSAKNQETLAVEDFTRAVSLQPLQASYYLQRGVSLLRNGQYQRAVDDFTKVMELEPENPYARGRRARGLFYLGQTQKALDDLLQAIRLNPNNAALYRLRGDIHSASGSFENSIRDYDAAIQLKPDNSAAYNNRGIALANLGRTREAVADLNKAMEIASSKPSPDPPAGARETPW
jgi:tetratricopeptide (TPR) repeat protein